MGNLKTIIIVAVLAFVGYNYFIGGDSNRPESADLGQVLDRTVFALEKYDTHLKENKVTEAGDAQFKELTGFMGNVMNQEPRFHEAPIGVQLRNDATFEGFADRNGNKVKDSDEAEVFTVEIDSEKKRLIATDTAGGASDVGFSGGGFLAGALIGGLLARQLAGGVKPGAFNDRKTTPRNAYKSPASARTRARSGGLGKGK
ncbi:MAG: hypothetical protein WA888_17910 [Burkholderiaceae bacterium]